MKMIRMVIVLGFAIVLPACKSTRPPRPQPIVTRCCESVCLVQIGGNHLNTEAPVGELIFIGCEKSSSCDGNGSTPVTLDCPNGENATKCDSGATAGKNCFCPGAVRDDAHQTSHAPPCPA